MAEGGVDGSIDSTQEPRPSEDAPTGDTETRVDQPQASVEGGEKPMGRRERVNVQTMGVMEGFRSQLKPDGSNAGELLGKISQGELKNLISDPRQLELAQKQLSGELSAAAGIKQERRQKPSQTVSDALATAPVGPETSADKGQIQTPPPEAEASIGLESSPVDQGIGATPEPVPENQPPQGSTGNTEKFDKVYLDVYRNWVGRGTRGEDLSGLESTLKIDDPEQKRILIDKIRSQVSRRFAAAAEPNSSEGQLAQAVAGVVENGGKSPAATKPQTQFETGAKFTPEPVTPIGQRFVPENQAAQEPTTEPSAGNSDSGQAGESSTNEQQESNEQSSGSSGAESNDQNSSGTEQGGADTGAGAGGAEKPPTDQGPTPEPEPGESKLPEEPIVEIATGGGGDGEDGGGNGEPPPERPTPPTGDEPLTLSDVRVPGATEYLRSSDAERAKVLDEITQSRGALATNEQARPIFERVLAGEATSINERATLSATAAEDLIRRGAKSEFFSSLDLLRRRMPEVVDIVINRYDKDKAFHAENKKRFPNRWEKMWKFAKNKPFWLMTLILLFGGTGLAAGSAAMMSYEKATSRFGS